MYFDKSQIIYIYHVIFVLILFYNITVSKASKYIEKPIKIIFLIVIFIILFQVGVFKQIILDSRNRGHHSTHIINKDKSIIWLYNIPFSIIWINAILYFFLIFKQNSLYIIDIDKNIINSKYYKWYSIITALSSLYIILFYIFGGRFIKPLKQEQYTFEPILGAILATSGIINILIYNNKIKYITNNKLSAFIVGFSALYYFIWRLSGGLIII